MTPDQLPAGLRVKALEWKFNAGSQKWTARPYEILRVTEGNWAPALYADGMHEWLSASSCGEDNAKAICQRHHEEQVCAQLEIVNG